VTLPREWGRHCSTEYCTLNIPPQRTHTSWNGGGDRGCSPWQSSPKHGTARRLSHVAQAQHCTSPIPPKEPALLWNGGRGGDRGCSPCRCPSTALHVAYPPPSPTSCPGKINVAQAWHCTSPIPPEEPALHGMRGGDRGCSPWHVAQERHCKSPIPPPRKTHHTCNGGGGDRKCSTAVHVAYPPLPHVAYPPHTPRRLSPHTPPPQYVLEKSKLKMRLTYLVVYQKRQTTH
jgi:hypothetical protein